MLESIQANKFTYKRIPIAEQQARGILGRLVGIIADTKAPTRNGRRYDAKLWENVFNSDVMKEKIANRCVLGELGHPADREETDITKAAVCLAEQPKIGTDGKIYGVFDIINTPSGQILKALCDYGTTVGISSRGTGDLITDYNGNEAVDPETYNCECWDVVLVPAVKEARLQFVTESLEKKRYNKTLKQHLAESLNKANANDRKIMESALEDIGIDLEEGESQMQPKVKNNTLTICCTDVQSQSNPDLGMLEDGLTEVFRQLGFDTATVKFNLDNDQCNLSGSVNIGEPVNMEKVTAVCEQCSDDSIQYEVECENCAVAEELEDAPIEEDLEVVDVYEDKDLRDEVPDDIDYEVEETEVPMVLEIEGTAEPTNFDFGGDIPEEAVIAFDRDMFAPEHHEEHHEEHGEHSPEKALGDLVTDEYEAVAGYKKAAHHLPEYADVLNDIAGEEYAHIGELEQALGQETGALEKIDSGRAEASGVVEEAPVEEALTEGDDDEFKDLSKEKFIEYAEPKIAELGTVVVTEDDDPLVNEDTDIEVAIEQEIRDWGNCKVLNPSSATDAGLDYDQLIAVTENNEVYVGMIPAYELALRMEFDKISKSFYDEILEYWEEIAGEYEMEEELTEEADENVAADLELTADDQIITPEDAERIRNADAAPDLKLAQQKYTPEDIKAVKELGAAPDLTITQQKYTQDDIEAIRELDDADILSPAELKDQAAASLVKRTNNVEEDVKLSEAADDQVTVYYGIERINLPKNIFIRTVMDYMTPEAEEKIKAEMRSEGLDDSDENAFKYFLLGDTDWTLEMVGIDNDKEFKYAFGEYLPDAGHEMTRDDYLADQADAHYEETHLGEDIGVQAADVPGRPGGTVISKECNTKKCSDKKDEAAHCGSQNEELVAELKEALKKVKKLEKDNKILQEKLSVSNAKETTLVEEATRYKKAAARLSDMAKEVKPLRESLESANRNLETNKKESSKKLTESLTKNTETENNLNTTKAKLSETSKQLDKAVKLAESYKSSYTTLKNEIIKLKAKQYGVDVENVTKQLGKSYKVSDIDRVCESLAKVNRDINKLPINLTESVKLTKNMRVKVVEKQDTNSDDYVDPRLLDLFK